MKVMPRSIAERIIRRLRGSSTCARPRCHPPRPIAETRSPVLPIERYVIPLIGTSGNRGLRSDPIYFDHVAVRIHDVDLRKPGRPADRDAHRQVRAVLPEPAGLEIRQRLGKTLYPE